MTSLPDYADALSTALDGIRALDKFESVSLGAAGGRILAESVCADRDLPPFNRAMMDGYALRASEFDSKTPWPVVTTVSAGQSADVEVPNGKCVAIATGAPLPAGVDTVIPYEWSDRGDKNGESVSFTVKSIEKGHAVHLRAADAKAGKVLIESGSILQSHHLGIAAAVGKTNLRVIAKPQVAILSSGDEVVPASSDVQPHQIRNSNAPMLRELIHHIGGEVTESTHIADDCDSTISAVKSALKKSDLIITIGGISAGDRDYFPVAFDECGVALSLKGASIQPGRPILVGRSSDETIVIGLPGNPVSALACTCLFTWPIIRKLLGLDPNLLWREVKLAEPVKPNPKRRAFRPAQMIDGNRVRVPQWAGSGDLAHTAITDGLLELPVQTDQVKAGTQLRFLPWP